MPNTEHLNPDGSRRTIKDNNGVEHQVNPKKTEQTSVQVRLPRKMIYGKNFEDLKNNAEIYLRSLEEYKDVLNERAQKRTEARERLKEKKKASRKHHNASSSHSNPYQQQPSSPSGKDNRSKSTEPQQPTL